MKITEFSFIRNSLSRVEKLKSSRQFSKNFWGGVVKEKEPETLRYQCYFNKDQSKSYLVEEYPNTEALRAHALHVALALRKLLKISKITKATVLGELNPVAREALSIVGAENFRYYDGRPR